MIKIRKEDKTMMWTGLNELRRKYLEFFESKGHLKIPSFSLVPNNDKSLLLINSGMAPMKKYFTGEVTPPKNRVATCQKCIRTPDIDRVGITARHGTFFEMLGNFSFGDYFKNEATKWAWEFCIEVLEMPADKIFISTYKDDNETFDIWTKYIGIDPKMMVKLGKKDNFWEHGAGPCGPCSELYFDRGLEYGCGSEECGVGCDCDRYIEFWNLVFTQFENDGAGNYSTLDHPNIDTGMGLERLACVMQNVDNLFLVDTVQNIMKHVSKISNVKYGEDKGSDVSLRVITDHIRSTVFMISDGIVPSNEGRGYVLRRLLRRAARHGKLLGVDSQFLADLSETVIKENKEAYPILEEKKEFIKKVINVEEKSFSRTINQGLQILNTMIEALPSNTLSGEDVFKLNDTYGFPIDLTKEIASEKNINVDEKQFNQLMSEQKKRARDARNNIITNDWRGISESVASLSNTKFVGYDKLEEYSYVLSIIAEDKTVEYASKGEAVVVVLESTPFYAEGGGQVGDKGEITSDTCSIIVKNTVKSPSGVYLHQCIIKDGSICCGDRVIASVNAKRRSCIMRNHTAAHLLQAALRKVLGNHVEQAGQLVNEKQVRFDFTHFSPLSREEIEEIEDIINQKIFESVKVITSEMSIDKARELGAMALFGEKYGSVVRVVDVKDSSIELCGGTHVDNTSKLGIFKIVNEGSVALGVRRVEAVTSIATEELLEAYSKKISSCISILKLNNYNDLELAINQILNEIKDKNKVIDQLQSKISDQIFHDLINKSEKVKDINIITSILQNCSKDMLKMLCDKIKNYSKDTVVVIAGIYDGRSNLVVSIGENLQGKSGLHAGKIAKEVSQLTGGNGGGSSSFAMAGVKDISKLEDAILYSKKFISNMKGEF